MRVIRRYRIEVHFFCAPKRIRALHRSMQRPFFVQNHSGLPNPRTPEWHRRRGAAVAAGHLCLISLSAMRDAIREARVHRVATEVEIRFSGVADGPFANAVAEIEQARLARDFGAGPCGDEATRRRRCGGRCLIARPLTQEAAGTDRAQLRAGRAGGDGGRERRRRRRRRARHVGEAARCRLRCWRRRSYWRRFRRSRCSGLGLAVIGFHR